MKTQIVTGSIADIATKNNQSIAETFLSCDCIVIVDISGSMHEIDRANTNKTRYEYACEALRDLQGSMPGKIAVISFSDNPQFEPTGIPRTPYGNTELDKALKFVKIADNIPDMKFILISDGWPSNEKLALDVAKTFKNKIDVIFVGNEHDIEAIRFMNELAKISGGKQITAESALIAEKMQYLLGG